MKRMYGMFVIVIYLIFASQVSFAASLNQQTVAVIVNDSSKTEYGSVVTEIFRKQIAEKLGTYKIIDGNEVIKKQSLTPISMLELPDLRNIAPVLAADIVLYAEIMPTKMSFQQILFFQGIKADATIKTKVFSVEQDKYLFADIISGMACNETFIPYTSVGSRPAVINAVKQASIDAANKVASTLPAKTDKLDK